jgi:hypothetical protein
LKGFRFEHLNLIGFHRTPYTVNLTPSSILIVLAKLHPIDI